MSLSQHRLTRRGLFTAAAGVAGASLLPATGAHAAGTVDYPAAHWVPADSSNFTVSSRPSSYPIDYVVIHVTQEYFADAVDIFQDPSSDVSIHYLVRSADGYVDQLVREHDIAWHAGNWDYNTRSIGIEHEGWVDDPSWFTANMYHASAALTRAVCDRYGVPIDRNHIIGHYEVPGTDHTDPGPYFDWQRYLRLVNMAG
ncbi:MAG: N-acetylmuramoyl-L-alanine amidase [Actinocatenispora sp.]